MKSKIYLVAILLIVGLSVLFFGNQFYKYSKYKEVCAGYYNTNVGIHISFDSKSDTNKIVNYSNSFKLLNEVKEVKVTTKEETFKKPEFADVLKNVENPFQDEMDISFKNPKTIDIDYMVASLKKEAEKNSLQIDDIQSDVLKGLQQFLTKNCF